MLKKDKHIFFTLAVLFDGVFIAGAWMLCYVTRFTTGLRYDADASTDLSRFVKVLPLVVVFNLFALGFLGLYRLVRAKSLFREMTHMVRGAVLGWLASVAALYYYSPAMPSRIYLGMFLFAGPLALTASRAVLRVVMRSMRRRGWGVRTAAIIGTGRVAQKTLEGLQNDPWMGVNVEYFIAEDASNGRKSIRGIPVRGSTRELMDIIREHPVDSVFVAIRVSEADQVEDVLDTVVRLPVTVAVVPNFRGVVQLNTSVDELNGLPVIQLVDSPIQGWYAVTKRIIDVVGALLLLAVCALPMLILAAMVKLTSPGPVLFRQRRMGLGGRPFKILKFRSMHVNAEEETGPVWASKEDKRCTRLGAFMRRLSLDELPQLFNVLWGNMSLVGPRPERPHFVDEFSKTLPAYMLRHNVKAGMTGWAQISGLRGDTSLKKRLQYDLYYLDNWSLSFDLFILLRTPFVIFASKNAD